MSPAAGARSTAGRSPGARNPSGRTAARGAAARAEAARASGSAAPSAGRRSTGTSRAALSVLDRKALLERARRRRARALLAASGLLVACALGLVAGAQGVVTSQQLRLDRVDQQLAQAVDQTQSLEVTRARLAAPSRVLGIAEHQLHMITPPSITYLTPVAPVVPASRGSRR